MKLNTFSGVFFLVFFLVDFSKGFPVLTEAPESPSECSSEIWSLSLTMLFDYSDNRHEVAPENKLFLEI
jgi:hypothetical protein